MSNDPFQGWATQTYKDTQRLSQTIDTFDTGNALCGIGPLGGELNARIGSSVALLEWETSRLEELEVAAYRVYLTDLYTDALQ